MWVRAPLDVLERFEALPAGQRGAVIRAGLEALGLLEVEDAEAHE
ncbi:hypothetical protein [Meiothermus luteus]|nr:hypothetical protein [Meiothermus luteus]